MNEEGREQRELAQRRKGFGKVSREVHKRKRAGKGQIKDERKSRGREVLKKVQIGMAESD